MEGDASISTVGDERIWATRQDNGHGVGLWGDEEEEGAAKGLVGWFHKSPVSCDLEAAGSKLSAGARR